MKELNLKSSDIAGYFLKKAVDDGDLLTNLKMQKLVYYAYCWVLVLNDARLFNEHLQAWPNGPVSPSLYKKLSQYGYSPISKDFIKEEAIKAIDKLDKFTKYTLDSVYASYIPMAAFELVTLTHNELPWKNARKGLTDTEPSNKELEDKDILEYFSKL